MSQAKAGLYADALKSVKLGACREDVLAAVAAAQAEAGLHAEALAHAEEIDCASNASKKLSALASIDSAQARAGLYADALRTVDRIEPQLYRAADAIDGALAVIAAAQTQAGKYVDAVKTVLKMKDWLNVVTGLATIALAQAKAGRIQDSQGTFTTAFRTVQQGCESAEASAPYLVAAGVSSNVAQIEKSAALRRYRALAAIAAAQADAAFHADALRTAGNIECPRQRVAALTAIATAQGRASLAHDTAVAGLVRLCARYLPGGFPLQWYLDAKVTLIVAARSVGKIEAELDKISALKSIATAQAEVGFYGDAVATARKIGMLRDDEAEARVLTAIATAQARAGLTRDAQGTLDAALRKWGHYKAMIFPYERRLDPLVAFRAKSLREAAADQANAGWYDGAFQTVTKIEGQLYDALAPYADEALADIARAQVRRSEWATRSKCGAHAP